MGINIEKVPQIISSRDERTFATESRHRMSGILGSMTETVYRKEVTIQRASTITPTMTFGTLVYTLLVCHTVVQLERRDVLLDSNKNVNN